MRTLKFLIIVVFCLFGGYLVGFCVVQTHVLAQLHAMEAEGYSADIVAHIVAPKVSSGADAVVVVNVWNIGSAVWEPNGTTALGLFEQKSRDMLTGREGHGNEPQWRFKPKGAMRRDGNSEKFSVTFKAPTEPGVYHMRLQMVDERLDEKGQPIPGRWFGPIVRFDLTVSNAAGILPAALLFQVNPY